MLRSILGKKNWFAFVPVVKASELITETKITSNDVDFVYIETGWDRVKQIFKPTKYEEISPEMCAVSVTSTTGLGIGAILGGFIRSRNVYVHFMENNHASQFASHLDAKEFLTNHLTAGMLRGGAVWGLRIAFICFTWTLLSRLVIAYQNQNGIVEGIATGLVTGTLGGHLFRNLKTLDLHNLVKPGKFIGGRYSAVGGALVGSAFGIVTGAYSSFRSKREAPNYSVRYWEHYWKNQEAQRKQEESARKGDVHAQ